MYTCSKIRVIRVYHNTSNTIISSETVENDREEIPYPIAIAIIETASAVFKPNDEYEILLFYLL